jgi:hypothetical protein
MNPLMQIKRDAASGGGGLTWPTYEADLDNGSGTSSPSDFAVLRLRKV